MPEARPTPAQDSEASAATTSEPRGAERRDGAEDRMAKALGWFSIGLGLPQVLAPGQVNRLIGVEDTARNRAIMRAVGLRELTGAAGILDRPRPSGFLFARVAGDAMDLALLGAALASERSDRERVTAAATAVAGVAVLDVIASTKTSRSSDPGTAKGGLRARAAITVNRSPDDVYGYWHRFENLPTFMYHLEAVEDLGQGRSHWVAKGPAGTRVEWDAEIVEDVADRLIAWRSLEDADVPNSGSVRLAPAPGGRGTEVRVEVEYRPPAGAVGASVARLLGEDAEQQLKDDLRRFKQAIETGEVVRSDASPEGSLTQRQVFQREAHPGG